MLGTPAELEAFYVTAEDPRSPSSGSVFTFNDTSLIGRRWKAADFVSLYGASRSADEMRSLAERLQRPRPRDHHRSPAAAATPASLKKALDASALPPVHPTWKRQRISVADEGVFAIGRSVYLALRLGLLAEASPFPDDGVVAAVVVAASPECFRHGRWTSRASEEARRAMAGGGENGGDGGGGGGGSGSEGGGGGGDGAWNDENRVYVLLPRQCVLAPGATGDVACAAYGVGWACDGRLENYTDLLSGRAEVLARQVTMAPSGLVVMLSVATLFLVDVGPRLSLPGWSGVLSVVAQYRAQDAYSSRVAARAVLAVRSGRANFASARDLVASTVPTVWYPLLALGAEAAGGSGGAPLLGGAVCAAAVGILLYAHRLKLLSYGADGRRFGARGMLRVAVPVLLSPAAYRLLFYCAFSSLLFLVCRRFLRDSSPLTWLAVAAIFAAEVWFLGVGHGLDPGVTSAAARVRWIAAGVAAVLQAYFWGEDNRGGKLVDPKPYTLSGWSHARGGITAYASRYIVEYGYDEEDGFSTTWRG